MHEVSLVALTAASAGIALTHTLAGPDHYVPFILMARAGRWSPRRAVGVCLVCGVGHVLSSLALGAVGVLVGWGLTGLTGLEELRGSIAGWVLLGFGVAYTAWGIRMALRRRPHAHWHAHADGTVHHHPHSHVGEHAHRHTGSPGDEPQIRHLTPWVVFVIFILGPCEPLIPLVYAAAAFGTAGVVLVTLLFGLVTLATMGVLVAAGLAGLRLLPLPALERYTHALAGAALTVCGAAMTLGL